MHTRWISLYCALIFLFVGFPPLAAQELSATRIYLPFVSSPRLADVTAYFSEGPPGYPTYYSLSGQVTNLTTVPLSVTIEIEMISYPYMRDPYISTMRIHPVLEATLPGEENWFFMSWLLGKASIGFVGARIVGAVPLEGSYHSLQLIEQTQNDTDLVGIVRNDTRYVLEDVRVVVLGCEARGAQLTRSILQPGETASFRLAYCTNTRSNILTQGKARLP
jgi:hypothetical protein